MKRARKILVVLGLSVCSLAGQGTNSAARLPEVTVTEPSDETLDEEKRVGPNQQPEWTTQRRFATTRIYVLEPWQVEFEQWWRGKYPREGKGSHRFQSEIGIGLPHRFQVDLYENLERNEHGTFRHQGVQAEVRYALAEWGKIPLNPTLYGEWKFNHHASDAFEVKLLLGDEIAPCWHWGFNAFYEQEIHDGFETEVGFATAISYTIIDGKLSAGVEMNFEHVSAPHFHNKPEIEFLIGPSVQWRPCPRVHLDMVPLFGTTDDSPLVEAFVVLGIDFGPAKSRREINAPASTRTR
jgi:hypothetical protein